MMDMHSSFYWGKHATILFGGWPNQSLSMYILAVFCVFVLAMVVELSSALATTMRTETNPTKAGFRHSLVYGFRLGLAYLVMLALMSFNLGVFLAALVGHALGFFIFKARALAIAANQEEEP